VVFAFALAGPGSRALAWILDLWVMTALWAAGAALAASLGVLFGGVAMALYFVIAFLVQWGYGAFFEWRWAGQTVGKRVVGLRVLSAEGTRISFMQSVVRNLVRVVDLLPLAYLAGGATALLDRHGRRLGDIAAGTVVVRERRAPRPSFARAAGDAGALSRDAAVVRAMARITPPEREAMFGLVARRESLPLPVRYGLFARLGAHLEARLGIARPGHLSDENFVVHLAAALAAAQGTTRPGSP